MRGLGVVLVSGLLIMAFGLSLGARTARACGGLFCNASSPVNQAAERIVFVENGDGTVTAVIEIQYEGPAERFSWVLPVPGVPDLAVSSTSALDRLQQATNPQYMLQTRFEDGCAIPRGETASGDSSGSGGSSAPPSQDPNVIVLAAGTVGPFDYEVISLDPDLEQPADAAIDWLAAEGYDVTALGPDVLGPYLANGLNLIAFRLNKQNDAGSIRPVVMTYEAELPFIPIRPTAVAANEDMGVMVWVISQARAVPDNYKALELNEALIDWFSPMSTYDDVVSAAADEAAGQGFVTELADRSDILDGAVLGDFETAEWERIANQQYDDPASFVIDASIGFGQWDGFEDALRSALTLPEDVAFSDFASCPRCYASDERIVLDQDAFRLALYEDVYKPVADTQSLLLSRPYVTRLYTTMSAEEMTMDPAFNFNPDLPEVSNVHVAEQILDCEGGFRIVLSDGEVVYGQDQGVWPNQIGDLPAARKIVQFATSGQGEIVEDNSGRISELLAQMRPDTVGIDPGGTRTDAGPDGGTLEGGSDGGCAVSTRAGRDHASVALWFLLALGSIARRRTRRG